MVEHRDTSVPQVLYEARLAVAGRKLMRAWLIVLTLWIAVGAVLCFVFTSFPGRLVPLGMFALGAIGFSIHAPRMMRMRRNAGCYRISMDDHGLYVHSDDPSSAPLFSVTAPDLHRLVRKTLKQYESNDGHEYYLETKSGARHRIDQLFADYDLDVMKMFQKISERFPWVEMIEEVKQ